MKLFVILMVVFLHFHFLLLASECSTLEIQEHGSIKDTETEYGREQHVTIRKLGSSGGGGGGRGGFGGGGRGSSGRGGGRGSGGMLPFYGAAGAAGAAGAHGSRSHHRGSTCRTAQFGWTLPSFLIGLGICLMQF